jgi:hypothetical protein
MNKFQYLLRLVKPPKAVDGILSSVNKAIDGFQKRIEFNDAVIQRNQAKIEKAEDAIMDAETENVWAENLITTLNDMISPPMVAEGISTLEEAVEALEPEKEAD